MESPEYRPLLLRRPPVLFREVVAMERAVSNMQVSEFKDTKKAG
jgi:hypothetical protein